MYLIEGIYVNNFGEVVYDENSDSVTDVINCINPDIYESEFLGNVYYFGYTFNDNASRKDRTTILKWLKNIDNSGISNRQLEQFINRALNYANKKLNFSEFSALLYPRSNRSDLTKSIVSSIGNFTQHDMKRISFEFVKNSPKDVSFDWESFNADYEGEINDNQYNQIYDYIENILIPKIHDLSYFSIADNVKPKYRKYIQNYLTMSNRTNDFIQSVKDGKILIVDDINTSGSTLKEILRLVQKINNNCDIYIFTLIGK
jgi:hypothetical protein